MSLGDWALSAVQVSFDTWSHWGWTTQGQEQAPRGGAQAEQWKGPQSEEAWVLRGTLEWVQMDKILRSHSFQANVWLLFFSEK
jgi:hypothetical protein